MKRVAVIIPFGKTWGGGGGSERRYARIAEFISKNYSNFRIYFVLSGKQKPINNFVDQFLSSWPEDQIIPVDDSNILSHLRSANYDIVQFVNVNRRLFFLYRKLGSIESRIVLALNDYYIASGEASFSANLAFKNLSKHCDVINCLYPGYLPRLSNLVKQTGIKEPLIEESPVSFTDLDSFKPSPEKNNEIVFAARLEKGKNPILFLEVVSKAREIILSKNYKVIICGNGKLYKKVLTKIRVMNLSKLIDLKAEAKMENVFPTSKIFFSIQQMDNYPSQSLIEAISCGNFIIATCVGNTRLMIDNSFGDLVEPTVESMVTSLSGALSRLENRENSEEIIRKARNHALQNFIIDKQGSQVADIWERL